MTGSGLCWQDGGMRPTAYRRNARGLRDRQAFGGVRMQAGGLFAAGRSQAQVARTLGVARQNVSRWHAQWRQGGLEALRSAGPTGHAPRLSDQQLHRIDQALRQGARAHGFDTDHWTLARVTTVIQRLTGSPTTPATCGSCCATGCTTACNAPPAAPSSATSGRLPTGWPRTGPSIRANARRRRAAIVFWDESGASLLPVTRPDLGAGRPHPGDPPPLQMEAGLHGRRALLRLPRRRRAARLPPPARRLRHRQPDRRAWRAAPLSRRAEGDPFVGRAARPPQPRDARLAAPPAVLAGGGAAARLRPRPQPGGGAVVQPQGRGAGQPRRREPRRGHRGGRVWHPTDPGHPPSAVLVPALLRSVPMVSNDHVTGISEPLFSSVLDVSIPVPARSMRNALRSAMRLQI